MRLPDIMASLDGLELHVPSLFLYLATKMSELTAILRYVALLGLRLCSALHLSISVDYLHSGTIWHIITVRCLLADILRIQRLVLLSRSPYPLCHVNQHLLTSLMSVWWRVMFFLFPVYSNQTACEITFPSLARSTHDRPGCGWQVARIRIPHIRRSNFFQCRHGPGTFPRWQGCLCAAF